MPHRNRTTAPKPAETTQPTWAHAWATHAGAPKGWDARSDAGQSRAFPRAQAPGAEPSAQRPGPRPLYTPAERARRDATVWTLVQGVLAPLQFLVFLVSLVLVLRFLATGQGQLAAEISIVIKTLVLYAIMITGSIWEKVVFGRWLFAPAFFWEDVVSFLVLALHTAYLIALFAGWGGPAFQMGLALAAYASYVINAGQFLWKLRMARLQGAAEMTGAPA